MRRVILGLLGWLTAMAGAGVPALEAGERRAVTFERDVEPILTRAGCNAGACHGKARGQNGFALSLLGFDPDFDHDAMTREGRGRAASLRDAAPEQACCSLKATAAVPHGGGPAAGAGHCGLRGGAPLDRGRDAPDPGRCGRRWCGSASSRPSGSWTAGSVQRLRGDGAVHRRLGRGRDAPGRVPVERAVPSSRSRPEGWSRPGRSPARRRSRPGIGDCSPAAR